jgi:hypothetical protein
MATYDRNAGLVDSGDSADALAALYTAERSEVQSILAHALSLVSIIRWCHLGD